MKKETVKKPVVKKEVVTVVTTTTTTETVKAPVVETPKNPVKAKAPKTVKAKAPKKSVKAKVIAAEHKAVEVIKHDAQVVKAAVVKAEHKAVEVIKHDAQVVKTAVVNAEHKVAAEVKKDLHIVADKLHHESKPKETKPKERTYSATTTEKKAVIVYAHPYNGSYAAATLEAAKKGLESKGKKYDVIDLHAEGYDPIYHGRELAQYSKGIVVCEKSKKYAQMIKEADELVFIYPTWWGGMPAILKGFVDKVFLAGDGFWETLKPRGVFPFLWGRSTWIKRVSIFTTSFTPNQVSKMMLGNISKHNAKYAFKAMRMRNVRAYNIDRVATRSRANKEAHLKDVTRRCSKELYR